MINIIIGLGVVFALTFIIYKQLNLKFTSVLLIFLLSLNFAVYMAVLPSWVTYLTLIIAIIIIVYKYKQKVS